MNYSVSDLLAGLLDAGTFRPWADEVPESVVTGAGLIRGHRVAIAASDFTFQGGSIGLVAGERLTRAVERATAEGLPFIAMPASGGTRMQEGTIAFLQMLKVTAAITAHKAAGLPYLAYLRHPTTGGVLASWASLAHLTFAEPGALIGFLGPRVYAAVTGQPFPAGVQVAEHLHTHGLVDAVVPPAGLAARLADVLAALPRRPAPPIKATPLTRTTPLTSVPDSFPQPKRGCPQSSPSSPSASGPDAWESVRRTREGSRPRASSLLRAATEVSLLTRDGGLTLALAQFGGSTVVVAGQDGEESFRIRGLRLARRGMRLASELRLPFVTLIDTPGAELSPAAEEAGIAREIAQCIALLAGLRVPTVAVLLGQGTGGGALALLPADRVLAAEHAWLAPLAPEGASAIVYRDADHAPELARAQSIRAADLAAAGVVDAVVPEAGDWPAALAGTLGAELASLSALSEADRQATRMRRFRELGRSPRRSGTPPSR